LTNDETVRLGRRLVGLLGISHVSYPDDTSHVEVEMWEATAPLSDAAVAAIEDVIGPFDLRTTEG
jgi:hypothetical protein